MGFDLHGMNPHTNTTPDEYPTYFKYDGMTFKDRHKILDANEKLSDKYWEERDKFYEDNPGIYFRNNCWWWRPLWQFVCERFDDILTEKDMESGGYNDGHQIDKHKAMKIGVELTAMLESGRIKAYSDRYKADIEALPKVVCYICNGNNHGNRKKKDCNACNKTGKKDDWATSYPFHEENVEEFAKFCLESGGFDIC